MSRCHQITTTSTLFPQTNKTNPKPTSRRHNTGGVIRGDYRMRHGISRWSSPGVFWSPPPVTRVSGEANENNIFTPPSCFTVPPSSSSSTNVSPDTLDRSFSAGSSSATVEETDDSMGSMQSPTYYWNTTSSSVKQPQQTQLYSKVVVETEVESMVTEEDLITAIVSLNEEKESETPQPSSLTLVEEEDEYTELDILGRQALVAENVALMKGYECYLEETHEHYKDLESRRKGDPNFMKTQRFVTQSMRSMIVSWLADVIIEFGNQIETFFAAINLLDRFLSICTDTTVNQIQLIGVTCLFSMSKTHDLYTVYKNEVSHITDNTYTTDEVLEAEAHIIRTVDYSLTSDITTYYFLDLYSNYTVSRGNTLTERSMLVGVPKLLVTYLLEMVLVDSDWSFTIPPSMITSAAILLSRAMMRQNLMEEKKGKLIKYLWPNILVQSTGYTQKAIMEVARKLHALVNSVVTSQYKNITEKYSKDRNGQVSRIPLLKDVNEMSTTSKY